MLRTRLFLSRSKHGKILICKCLSVLNIDLFRILKKYGRSLFLFLSRTLFCRKHFNLIAGKSTDYHQEIHKDLHNKIIDSQQCQVLLRSYVIRGRVRNQTLFSCF